MKGEFTMTVRTFSELDEEERKKLFDYTVAFGESRYFKTRAEMEKNCSGRTFDFGKDHFSAWKNGSVKGTAAAITREVKNRGEAYVTAVNVKEEDAAFFENLLDASIERCLKANAVSVKLGIKPVFEFLKPTIESRRFVEVHRSVLMRYEKTREALETDEKLLLRDLSDETKGSFRRIHNDAFRNSPNGGSLTGDEIEEMILEKSNLAGVAFYDGNPVGIYELTLDGKTGFIDGLGIDPVLHSKGFGRATLNAVMEKLYANGAAEIRLSVMSSNARAVELYKKTGFNEEKTLSVWFGKKLRWP